MYRNGKLRIILLEDNDTVRKVLSESLTYRGYEVFAYPKPTICPLQILPECRCTNNQSCTDVILTDLDMPGMDGLQFVENLKRKNCKCGHVGIMSGWLTSGDIQRAEELDCKIFQKPFKIEIFIEWLNGIQRVIKPSRELCNWFQRSPQSDS